MPLKIAVLSIILAILIISQTGCSRKDNEGELPSPLSMDGFYLDTICTITIYSTENPDDMENGHAADLLADTFSLCEDYENLLSKTIETSDIGRINSSGDEGATCNPETIDLIKLGMDYGVFSQGSFNITIGGLVDLWDFHAEEPQIPEEALINEALRHVGDLSGESNSAPIIIEGDTVRLSDPESKIDLGGIAKGYIADRLAEFLKHQGVTGGVIDLGGNIVVIGYKDGVNETQEIRVGIKKPYTEINEIVGAVSLHEACVVTSGTYERYIEEGENRYHHILDPKTGYPSYSGLTSVTVIGPIGTSGECDALATTILIKGEEWLEDKLQEPEYAPNYKEGNGYTGIVRPIEDYGFILIRDDDSIEMLGNREYDFNEL